MATAALLHWIPVLAIMIPAWLAAAGGNSKLTGPLSLVPIFHGLLGGFTQLLMTYTVTRMYWVERLPPEKPIWLMRTTAIFWLLTITGGIAVYLVTYVL
jgi:cytochrome b561